MEGYLIHREEKPRVRQPRDTSRSPRRGSPPGEPSPVPETKNASPDCRFNPLKAYRIYVCDRCKKPKTYLSKAMSFDGQFLSTDHRGRTLREMEALWRRGEGDWRWWCIACHRLPGESVQNT